MLKNFKLATKIGGGYGLMGIILISIVMATLWQVSRANKINERVMNLRTPTAQSSLMMLNGINHSLAALRGWMILGKPKFKAERNFSWSDEIEPAINTLKGFSENWTNPENIKRLELIETNIGDFKRFQQEIEDIAQTRNNVPAVKTLFEEAAPQATILATQITRMIDLEGLQPATPERKNLLGIMADLRGTTGLGLAAIRAYLLSGDIKFRDNFDKLWTKNSLRFKDLQNAAHLLTLEQQRAFNSFSKARAIFNPLPQQMFMSRQADDWNRANHWLGTKAAPAAAKIIKALNGMATNQKELMLTDIATAKKMNTFLYTLLWTLLAIGIVACLTLGIVITRSITVPIQQAVEVIQALEKGDLSKQLSIQQKDEVGVMATALNQMSAGLRTMIIEIRQSVETLTSTSTGLSDISQQMSVSAEQTSGKSASVAAAAEEMSTNMNSVAAATEEAATNVNMVASAAEEMTATINEITSTTSKTSSMTENAAAQALSAKEKVNELGDAASEISKVTETITDISEQTNLLALNATIEAARAGEAGKGFAVVANEIKDLAKQTSEATMEIKSKIENVQKSTEVTVKEITRVNEAINNVNEMTGTVATAIEEQSVTTKEIANNVSQASMGIHEVTENVAQSSTVSGQVASDIAEIDQSSTELLNNSKQVNSNSDELNNLAEKLSEMMHRFKV